MHLLTYLSDCCDGAVELGQVLMQFLYLQVQGLGFQLLDLLNLGEGGRRGRERD